MFSVPPTEAPLAAAELVTVRVALSRSGAVRENKLWATPPVLSPEPHPLLDPLVCRPVVHTGVALAVLRPGAAIAPVRAAVVLGSSVTLTGLPVRQRELKTTAPV